jgi:polygalacturonase
MNPVKPIFLVTLLSSLFTARAQYPGSPLAITQTPALSLAHEPRAAQWYIDQAPFPMKDLSLPVFPPRVFRLTDYGAVGDGQTLCTAAFREAIKACSAAGGGFVMVPAGRWLTGPIELLSHVNLQLGKGALVQFTMDHSQYPAIGNKGNPASPVYSVGQEDIAITGEGTMDGAGETWRPVKKGKMTAPQWRALLASGGVLSADGQVWWPSRECMENDSRRPYMVAFTNCHRILIEGVTLRNSPKFVFYPSHCTDILLKHAHIYNEWWAQNGDGIDISACKRVIVYACTVSAGDDGICMKSSGGGADETPALEDVIVAGCTVYRAHGGFVIGSNTDGGMHNLLATDCSFVGTDVGLRFKSNMGRGGLVHDVYCHAIEMKNIVHEGVLFDTYYEDMPAGATRKNDHPTDKTPEFRDFHFSGIHCEGAAIAISVTGLPQMPVSNLWFDGVDMQADKPVVTKDSRDIHFQNVRINGVSYSKPDGD